MKTSRSIGNLILGIRDLIVMGLAVGLLAAMPAAAADIYVSTNGAQTADYDTWANAFTDLQAALDYAATEGGVSTIHVAGQTFLLSDQIVWTTSGLTIRGGYEADPDGASPGNHNPEQWPTVIQRSGAFNHRIMYINGADNSALEDVTITGGNVAHGAGLRIDNSADVWLRGCIISNNAFSASAGSILTGGGIRAAGSSVTLTNCLVYANAAVNTPNHDSARSRGGGIWSDGTLALQDCVVLNNSARRTGNGGSADGGGIYFAGTTLTLDNV